MVEELLSKLLGMLDTIIAEKGVPKDGENIVDKNIAETPPENKVNPNLTSPEKRRLTETFNLFNKLFFEYKAKVEGDKKPTALISQINKEQKKSINPEFKKEKSGSGSLLSLLVGGVALVAASIPMLLGGIFDKFGSFSKAAETLGKIGLFGGLKMLAKTVLKFFAKPLLKRLPIIGSLIEFYDAYQSFKAGKPAKGILEIVAGIVGFVPGLGPILQIGVDILTSILDAQGAFDEGGSLSAQNAWPTIKKWGSNIGNWIWDKALYIPVLGTVKRFGMAYDSFKGGDYGEGIKQILWGLLSLGPIGGLMTGYSVLSSFLSGSLEQAPKEITENSSWSDKMVEWIRGKLKVLPWWIKKPLAWFGLIPDSMVGDVPSSFSDVGDSVKKGFESTKEFVGGIWDDVKGPMKDSVDTVKSFAVDTWEKTKEVSSNAWNYVSEEAPKLWDGIKNTASKAWDAQMNLNSMMWDGIKSMGYKAKGLIDGWVPKIVEVISNITKSAMDTLSNIAATIGNWITGLFSSDEKKKLQEVSITPDKQQMFSKENQESIDRLVKNDEHQTNWLKILNDTSYLQVRLLEAMVNIGNDTVRELKRMSGNTSGGSGSTYIMSSPQQQSTPLVPVGDNRNGYFSSNYSLGG
jgi:hypothetical protein